MPVRTRTSNIGRMPKVIGLPFSLALVFIGSAAAAVLLLIATAAFARTGAKSLLSLLLPVATYVLCMYVSNRYGEFYAKRAGKQAAGKVKTRAWVMAIENKTGIEQLKKEAQRYGE